MTKKRYFFRETGQDEGDVVFLTVAQAAEIQKRLDALDEHDPPFYLYEVGSITARQLGVLLRDQETANLLGVK